MVTHFNQGDKIVYPLYGAGIIESIEPKEVDGRENWYYVLRIPIGDLKIVIAAEKAQSLGIRAIYDKDTLSQMMDTVAALPIDVPENWNLRYKENMDRIRSGKLEEVALVYRCLWERERERGLSTAEKKMMTTAKQIVLSELILSQNVEKADAEQFLNARFKTVPEAAAS